MEPDTEKPPSPKIKTVSPEPKHVEFPEGLPALPFSIFHQFQETSRADQTRVQAENQPDRSSSDTTSSESDALQSDKGSYYRDRGESSQTPSGRRKKGSSVRPLRICGGTPFNRRKHAYEICSGSPVPYKISSFGIPEKATLPQKASTEIQASNSMSLSSLYDTDIESYPQSIEAFHHLASPESSHTAAQNTTLPPSLTYFSGRSSVVQHSSDAAWEPEEQAICSEPEPLVGSSSIIFEDTFRILTPPPSGLHEYKKSVPESGLTDLRLSLTQRGRDSGRHRIYGGAHCPNSDPKCGLRPMQVFHHDLMSDPLTSEPTDFSYPRLPPPSYLSSAADAVPSTTLRDLEFNSDLPPPSCFSNRNQTDDADPSSLMFTWGSQDTECDWSMLFENASGAESDHQMETNSDLPFSFLSSFPHSLPHSSDTPLRKPKRTGGCLTRCVSAPSLREIPPPIGPHSTVTQAKTLPNMHFRSSFEDFTPEITVELNEETFWFRCSCPGLYQCSVTGLVFHMTGDGVVVYRVVPWNRRLLAQHHKQPAGPLFDIKCEQRSVRRLYLPHCEIHSTDACHFLSVAHVEDESINFISPQKVSETHIIVNIARFSGFGITRDEDSPPELVRALVLLFYRPPSGSDNSSLLNVLLLPKNVVLREVLHSRKKLVGDERYIETSPHCKLQPKEEYTLSTCPEDDTVLVQPAVAEFDNDNYDNFFPSFQVSLETAIKHMKLFLRDSSQQSVWERRVCLSVSAVNQHRCPSRRNGPSHERLLEVRVSFIDGVSGPVLKSLLDKLFEKKVIADPEREEADGIQNRADRARFVIDTVRKKGDEASSEMIKILCEDDPFLCENLCLI